MGSLRRAQTSLVAIFWLLCNVEAKQSSNGNFASVLRLMDDKMEFKKGVRGECFETFLQLSDNAKDEAKKTMYEMDGWHQLAKYDGNWRDVTDAVAAKENEIEAMKSVIEKSEALEKIDPILKSVKQIKAFQREMTKQMLRLVKLAEKHKYVKYFAGLDYIGKKELPCVKAIQESYASKYPLLLDEVTSDVLTATTSELNTNKQEMKAMIDDYGSQVSKLVDDASKNSEIMETMKQMALKPEDRARMLMSDVLRRRMEQNMRKSQAFMKKRTGMKRW